MYITEYTCKVITPMLIHGADSKKTELRAPSIKGAMRFWWRAVNAGLADVVQREKNIFGGVNDTAQKSRVFVSVKLHSGARIKVYDFSAGEKKIKISGYDVGSEFIVRFVVKSDINNSEKIRDEVNRTFEILSLCGGLGMKTRRGYGAFSIVQKNGKDYNLPVEKYIKEINERCKTGECQVNTSIISVDKGKRFDKFGDFLAKVNTSLSASRKISNYKNVKVSINDVNCALGKAIGGRLASPVVISAVSGDKNSVYCITTKLYSKNDNDSGSNSDNVMVIQNRFINNLNGG